MLVLTRKSGERVLIGDDIVITVLDTRGDGVRIGIDAPAGVRIYRDEVIRAVTEENVAAAHAGTDAEERLKSILGIPSPSRPDAAAPTPATAPRPVPTPGPTSPTPGPTSSEGGSRPAPTGPAKPGPR